MENEIERRYLPPIEIRVTRENGKATIQGYSAVFNSMSEDMGFREFIRPGAFKSALKKSDVRALVNHDPGQIVGRKGVNLALKEDDRGLFMTLKEPEKESQRFNQLVADVENGLITGQSFGFRVKSDAWSEDHEKGIVTRELIEFDEVFDVSPVTYPAYPDTTIAKRGLTEFRNKSSVNAGAFDVTVENEDIEIDLITNKNGGN